MVIKTCLQRFFIDPLLYKIKKNTFYQFYKVLLLAFIGILCDHREDRLIDSVVIRTHNVFSYTCIRQRFFQRRARCGKQGIIQNLERKIQFPVKACTNHFVVGKIGIVLLGFLTGYRVRNDLLTDFPKRLLAADSGIYFFCVKITQVFLVKPLKLLFHVHIPVQVDITVGRMIIFPVKIQKLFIGKLWNHLWVAAGLVCIGSVREQSV